jgi:AraC-like DNA-binding protein
VVFIAAPATAVTILFTAVAPRWLLESSRWTRSALQRLPAMNITRIPALLGIVALAFLVLLVAKVIKQPAEDKTAKRLLILLLIGLFSMAYCLFYAYAGMRQYWPVLANIEIGLAYWIGPSLYFYIKRVNGSPSPFATPLNYLHWLPAILIELMLLPYFSMSLSEKVAYFQLGASSFYALMIRYTWAGFHVHVLIYILLCQPHLRVYRQRVVDSPSYVSVLSLRWLQLFCVGFMVQVLAERLLPALKITSSALSDTAGMAVYLFIIVLTYLALGQSRLQFADTRQPARSNGKYYRSGLREHTAQYYLDKLSRLMATEQYFLESDLSMQSLADRVKISPHHLSQILNEKLEKSFYDYVNEQRVNYARQLLLSEPQQPIVDIAFKSGYNSKNSFNNAFKRHTGTTPSEYRRSGGLLHASADRKA